MASPSTTPSSQHAQQPTVTLDQITSSSGENKEMSHETGQGASQQPATTHMSLPIDDGEFATTTTSAAPPQQSVTEDDADDTYPELEEQMTLQPPSDFKPFFTLIEDPVTGEHHHPAVHYIFADDDPDILTNAALHALHTDSDETASTNERFVVVDMSADGREVLSTASLSSRWQDVKSNIKQAPSWGNNSLNTQQMLCISGREPALWQRTRDLQRRKGDVSALIKALDETQAELESVVGRPSLATAS
ncbi:hypothetical protein CB0940_00685 [Cercospora beticola]|uniref:Uncharacterized protein n=1 Tax=Cercospora beticola TaxID=122368 RepID=A0A2G5IB57_CERBT|nr:hypothetical protein CB0940_00685 [Cercospora beticola]PIB02077.1 hypothetical protein CB0940_00685 [Cercospora beticola]WPA96113.1 hypothetical protein RHO25_000719 [Cercospora beticola]CAK1355600.1 unnamed protein product [Cercospora beticola]